MIPRDVRYAGAVYRSMGWQPIPSRPDAKRPAMNYREHWTKPIPKATFDRRADAMYAEHGSCNLQLLTGRRWGLACVDIDGPEALDTWDDMRRFREDPPAWRVESLEADGSVRGVHLFYSLSILADALPSRRVWGIYDPSIIRRDGGSGDWLPRCQIELKADLGIMIAPPSLHTVEGCSYRIVRGFDEGYPPELPRWIGDLPAFEAPRTRWIPPKAEIFLCRRGLNAGTYDWEDVLAAISDKVAEASSWGKIQFTGRRRGRDAIECHAFEREDSNPSAFMNARTGRYWSPWIAETGLCGSGRGMRFFDVAVACGAFPTFQVAVDEIGRRHCGRSAARGERRHA